MTDDGTIRELRAAAGDVHHGMRQEKARGDADTLAHIRSRAQESGASEEELSQITSGFVKIARDLLNEQAPRRRRLPSNPFRRASKPEALPKPPTPKQLPRGGPNMGL
jgi:hypothetical protein